MERIMEREIRSTNVCVVGGAGFLGSHLVNHLIEERQCNVLVIDNLITGQKRFVHPKATFQHTDITGSEYNLQTLFKQHEIAFVFNYAAEPYIPLSFKRPLYVFDINAFGALKVINAASEAGVKGVLQVSSAEIYGDVDGKINEQAPVHPHSSYGAAKAAIDAMVQVRWKEAQTPVIALRQFNCVGERETHPYVIPEIINQIADATSTNPSKEVMVNLGNNSFRDFQYAGDAVAMAVELLEKGQFGEVYNMGSEEGVQMYDLAKLIGKLMGVSVTVREDETRKRPWEIWHLQSDNTKLYGVISYRPKLAFEQALQRTIAWFKENGNKWDF
jgi:nucleoside-diphosphate-sugar epimerase